MGDPDMPNPDNSPIVPNWALVVAGFLVAIGLIAAAFFDAVKVVREGVCNNFNLWCLTSSSGLPSNSGSGNSGSRTSSSGEELKILEPGIRALEEALRKSN